jgi:hypothetical protein
MFLKRGRPLKEGSTMPKPPLQPSCEGLQGRQGSGRASVLEQPVLVVGQLALVVGQLALAVGQLALVVERLALVVELPVFAV